jgi:hypothetical protein
MQVESDAYKSLKRVSAAVLVALIVSVLTVIVLVVYTAHRQNESGQEASERQFRGLMELQQRQLAVQVQDYAFWDDMVMNLLIRKDEPWWQLNVADYTMASFKLSFSFLLDGQNQMLFNTQGRRRHQVDRATGRRALASGAAGPGAEIYPRRFRSPPGRIGHRAAQWPTVCRFGSGPGEPYANSPTEPGSRRRAGFCQITG